ncbi:MAG: hypothetical protein V9G24_13615 [Rhodoblastus sp.]
MAGKLVVAALALAHVFRQALEQRAHAFGGVGDQRGLGARETVGLGRIDVDAENLEVLVEAPFVLADQQARADAEHDIGLLPQAMADRHGNGQAVAAVDHAAARGDRRRRALRAVRQAP